MCGRILQVVRAYSNVAYIPTNDKLLISTLKTCSCNVYGWCVYLLAHLTLSIYSENILLFNVDRTDTRCSGLIFCLKMFHCVWNQAIYLRRELSHIKYSKLYILKHFTKLTSDIMLVVKTLLRIAQCPNSYLFSADDFYLYGFQLKGLGICMIFAKRLLLICSINFFYYIHVLCEINKWTQKSTNTYITLICGVIGYSWLLSMCERVFFPIGQKFLTASQWKCPPYSGIVKMNYFRNWFRFTACTKLHFANRMF